MVKLVGSYEETDHEYGYGGWTDKKTIVNEVVATFDNKKDAERYIKDSRLKNPSNRERLFKKKSLLSNFEFATIEGFEPYYPPPHNPEMEKRSK